jgi:hypothetical protein
LVTKRDEVSNKIKEELSKMTGKEIYVDIIEIKQPETDAQLVAENVALQLERRVSFRRERRAGVLRRGPEEEWSPGPSHSSPAGISCRSPAEEKAEPLAIDGREKGLPSGRTCRRRANP